MRNFIRELKREKKLKLCFSICLIVLSAIMQSLIMSIFMDPCNLISGGFTGLALLVNKVCALMNIKFPTSIGILL